MRPIDSSYDTVCGSSIALAESIIDTNDATGGETISYEDWEGLDDLGRDEIRRRLRKRGFNLVDNSCDMVVVSDDDEDETPNNAQDWRIRFVREGVGA